MYETLMLQAKVNERTTINSDRFNQSISQKKRQKKLFMASSRLARNHLSRLILIRMGDNTAVNGLVGSATEEAP